VRFYNRNGILYVCINKKRVSTKLKDTLKNRKLFENHYKNDEFLHKFGLVPVTVPTVVELCNDVLLDKEKYLKPTSYRSYSSLLKSRVVPFFQDKKVTDIKPTHIMDFYSTFIDSRTLITCEALLKPAFEKAILKEYINTTPFIVSKPKFTSDYKINPFTINDLDLISNYHKDDVLVNFLCISCFTGLRTGELFALEWKDIDFNTMTLDINKCFSGGYLTNCKTASSVAVIDLPIEALEYFKKQEKLTRIKSKYVFLSSKDTVIKYSTSLTSRFNKMLDNLNLSKRGIYQTRHTFASLRLSYGERLEWVSYMLRHKNPSITLTKYYKYMKRDNEERVIIDLNTKRAHTS
jgi:integrase